MTNRDDWQEYETAVGIRQLDAAGRMQCRCGQPLTFSISHGYLHDPPQQCADGGMRPQVVGPWED